jgi:dTDP-4-dehydrorhamnose reductase
MKPVILLIGKNGQIGGELLHLLPSLGEVVAPDRSQMDLSKPDDISQIIRKVQPQLIVNAAAYTAVDQAQTDEAMALAINAEAPGLMAREAKEIGATLIHYSTDYVFDGSKKAPYEETDPTNPINVYGRTKLEGEEAIRGVGIPHLIFRTAWVYATRGRNFLLTILRLASEREELKIVSDQTGAPTCASDIAAATSKVLTSLLAENSGTSSFSKMSGTYHMTAGGLTTWYEFANTILEEAAQAPKGASWFSAATQGRQLTARRVIPITTQEFRAAAPRPAYSVLSNGRLTQTFGLELPDWRAQLSQCFAAND